MSRREILAVAAAKNVVSEVAAEIVAADATGELVVTIVSAQHVIAGAAIDDVDAIDNTVLRIGDAARAAV